MLTNNRLFYATCLVVFVMFSGAYTQTIEITPESTTTDKFEVLVFVKETSLAAGPRVTKLRFLREEDGEIVKNQAWTGSTAFIRLPLKAGANSFSIMVYDSNNRFTQHAPLLPTITSTAAGPAPAPAPAANAVDLGLKKVPVTNDRTHPVEISPKNLPATAKNYIVQINGDPATRVTRAVTLIAGKLRGESIPVSLKDGKNKILVTVVDAAGNAIAGISDETEVEYKEGVGSTSENSRAIIGVEQVGASSADGKTIPFMDFFINVPFANKGRRPLSFWVNPRFSAASVQSFSSFANLSTAAVAPIFGTEKKINNVLQSFSLNIGLDYNIWDFKKVKAPFFLEMHPSVSLIVGGGVTTPLSSRQTAEEFKIPTVLDTSTPAPDDTKIDPTFQDLFRDKDGNILKDANGRLLDLTGKKNIAFVKAERDRFLRNWFVGARIQTKFDDKYRLFPGTFDVKFGQDETITQSLRGNTLSVEGFMPFPIGSNYVYFFGGVNIRLRRRYNTTVVPFFLESVSTPSLSNADTVIVNIEDPNLNNLAPFNNSKRDTFRFGIGIDLLHLKKPTPEPETPAAAAAKP